MSNTSINSNLEEAFKNSDWSTICAALMPHFNDYLARRSKNVFECEQVNTIDHVFTVPALYDDLAGTRKQVIVPMKVFTKNVDAAVDNVKKATDAANTAASKANTAASKANTAASNADNARADLDVKKQQVDDAVAASNAATDAAKKATSDTLASKKAIEQNETTRQMQESARVEAEKKRVAAENKRETDFSASKKACDDATAKANSTYSHPPYVDRDGYYYKWNVTTSSYNKTDVNLTGKAFQIKKVFASVSAMNATDVNTFAENDFILINTANVEDADNAKLYVVALNEQGHKFYSYLVDMSGFRGFTGKTPQFLIGNVTTLAEDAEATATVSASGTDTDGNPVYKLNLGIPKGIRLRFADLTDSDKAELMKPATDAAAESKKQTEACKTATDNANTQETVRQKAETTRNLNETTRQMQESARVEAEKKRVAAENKRETDFSASKKACDDATAKANSTYSHPPYVDRDGYYYKWNVTTSSYDKTDVNLTGKAFQIKKVFASVSAMNATDVNTFAENDFILINTANVEDADNAKLYVVALNEQGHKFYSFLVDMSGFRGFTGKTPQFLIGNVTTLAEDAEATASISASGTDTDGNPVYKLNLGIPKGIRLRFADLTDSDKAELMKPATDAAAASKAQTAACKTATDNAKTATTKANTAATNAGEATEASKTQTDLAKELNEHPQKQGDNGNWWKWNTTTKQYEDTGIPAKGGMLYPSMWIDGNALYLEDNESSAASHLAYDGNALYLVI